MIYDISPPISRATKVWPGEPSIRQEILSDIQNGDNVMVSILHSTVHVGAHADAPCHFIKNACSIGEVDLDPYIGRCQVIQIQCQAGEVINPDRLVASIHAERVLIKTQSFYGNGHWVENFAALSPEFVDHMKQKGIKLIGIDTPSVDPFHSKTWDAHKRFYANKMSILEGLDLTNISEGIYELIALPLKIIGFDASPVRAVLREIL
jgi:arylformamidase